jgi:hypothetical protein
VGVLATATVSAVTFSIERLFRSGGSSINPASPKAHNAHESLAPSIVECSRSTRIWQAMQGAVAIALIGLVNHFYALPNFAQSMVSVVAVLLVPLSVLVDGRVTEAVHNDFCTGSRLVNRSIRRVAAADGNRCCAVCRRSHDDHIFCG